MKKCGILFLAPVPPPHGGIATWMLELLKNGLSDQFELRLVNTALEGDRKVFEKAKMTLHEIKRNFKILLALLKQLVLKRPEIVDLSCSSSSFGGFFRDFLCISFCRLFFVPVVVRLRGSIFERYGHSLSLSKKTLFNFFFKISSALVVEDCSSLRFVQSMTNTDVSLCPNFLSDSFFEASSRRIYCSENRRTLSIGFLGGVTKKKGIEEVIALALHFKQVNFLMIGEVKDDMAAIVSSKKYPENCFFYGFIEGDLLNDVLNSIDIFIHPSHTEGFPLSVLESMARGFPIIASAVGALPEMIDANKGGFLVPPHDLDGFKNAITYFIDNPKKIEEMGRYNYQKSYQCYRYSVIKNEIMSLYKSLLSVDKLLAKYK